MITMNRDKALQKLDMIASQQENRQRVLESDHQDADEILLSLINDDAIRAAFERIEKWYA